MRRLATLAALFGTAACWSVPEVDRSEIRPWLVCSDCRAGELERVVGLGARAERYLRAAILDGPTAADDSILSRQLAEGITRARRYRTDRRISTPVSERDSVLLVTHQLDDFRLRYRLRAAEALAQIDSAAGSGAVRTICAEPPPELERRPEYRTQFARFGTCP